MGGADGEAAPREQRRGAVEERERERVGAGAGAEHGGEGRDGLRGEPGVEAVPDGRVPLGRVDGGSGGGGGEGAQGRPPPRRRPRRSRCSTK